VTKPTFAKGASFSLRSRAKVATPKPAVAPALAPGTASVPAAPLGWSAAVASNSDDVELLDEDELLDEEDKAAKVPVEIDCGTSKEGKRKACKNCSCGLREILENDDGNTPPPAKSACGNCSLGDAFRCANCPHLGKPAFDDSSGEVKLAESNFSSSVVTADAGIAIKPSGSGVVMLAADDMMDDL